MFNHFLKFHYRWLISCGLSHDTGVKSACTVAKVAWSVHHAVGKWEYHGVISGKSNVAPVQDVKTW